MLLAHSSCPTLRTLCHVWSVPQAWVPCASASGCAQYTGGAVPAQAEVVVAVGCRQQQGQGQAGARRGRGMQQTAMIRMRAPTPLPLVRCQHATVHTEAERHAPHQRLGVHVLAAPPPLAYLSTSRPLASLHVARPGSALPVRTYGDGAAGARERREGGNTGQNTEARRGQGTHSPAGSARHPPGARGTRI